MQASDALIEQLVADARPVSGVVSPVGRLFGWGTIAVGLWLLAHITVSGDWETVVTSFETKRVVLNGTLTLVAAFVAAYGALVLAVPGREIERPLRWVAGVVGFFLLSVMGFRLALPLPGSLEDPYMVYAGCGFEILLVGALPFAMLTWLIRRAAPLRPRLIGMLAFGAAGGVGGFLVDLACPNHLDYHYLLSHFTPLLVLPIIGALVGPWLFNARNI